MSKVILRRADYVYDRLKSHVFEIMDAFTGEAIKKGDRVVIKPNLLAPAPPERAMLTHPSVIRACVEYVVRKGAKAQVSDSPAMGSFEKVIRESGIQEALGGLPVDFREFKTSVAVDIGEPFKKIDIAEDAMKADVLINLPKLKTHTQMLLTLGVKNLFGCVVGHRKPEWHLRAGVDMEMFARLLVKIYMAVSPSLTLLDGILTMEGQGPGRGGSPREVGVLLGSDDAVAVDAVVCRMIGIGPDRLLTNRVAGEMGMRSEGIYVEGDEVPAISHFRLPEIIPVVFGPQRFHGLMRRHLVQRPECDDTLCALCGECWRYCPAKAISHDRKGIHFDYHSCIRCYCCVEVCPHGALRAKETLPGRVFRKALTKR